MATRAVRPVMSAVEADATLQVFVDDVVMTRRVGGSRFAESDLAAGHVLQFDGDVLEHVAEPGALVFRQTPHEAARFAVRASVFLEAGQRLQQRIVEPLAQAPGWPLFQLAEVEEQADDGEAGIQTRTQVDGTFQNFHTAS